MTPTTPREALAQIRLISGVLLKHEIDAILTALAPWLRTPGTVEVCKPCAGYLQINQGDCGDDCPLKQVTNEKA